MSEPVETSTPTSTEAPASPDQTAEPVADPTPAPDTSSLSEHETANPNRRERHRARSQQAGPGDAPRIAELTRRLRETERQLQSKGEAPARTPDVGVPPERRVPPPVPAAVASSVPVKSLAEDKEPVADDYDDYSKYVKDAARWEARQELRESNERAQQAVKQAKAREEQTVLEEQWTSQIASNRKKYADFDAVAFAPNTIPKGSLVDAWILEHRHGAELLYHLQKHPADVHRILSLPMLDQTEELTLLAQRFSNSRQQDAPTGSSAPPSVPRAPRPPNPVRTGPMSTGDESPGDDAPLSAHEAKWGQHRRR